MLISSRKISGHENSGQMDIIFPPFDLMEMLTPLNDISKINEGQKNINGSMFLKNSCN
jgi:hypothetical protein